MEYVIPLPAIEWLIDVGLLKIEACVAAEGVEIGQPSSQQIVDGNHRITFGQQCVTQMRTQETGPAGNQRAQVAHELLAFLGGLPAAIGGVSGVAAGRPTL